jgi:hypothetical protein
MVQLFVSCVTAGVLSVNSEALRSRRSASRRSARPLDDFVWSDLTASTASGTQPSQKISRRVLKAAWLAVPFRALAALAKVKNPKAPAVRPRTIGALNAHAAGTRTVTLDARTVAAHVSGSFLVIGTMPIGVVFLKLITHWLCIIVHEGLHRRAANSRPLGLSLDACFVVTDSAGQSSPISRG